MKLKTRLLDAILDGKFGTGIVVTRSEFIKYFHDVPEGTTGAFLSNSEMKTGVKHSPHYEHFLERIGEAQYRVHPAALLERYAEREGN